MVKDCIICNNRADFQCGVCGRFYCPTHTGSTEFYACKYHMGNKLSRQEFQERGNCRILKKSQCAKCNSELELLKDKNTKNFYLYCPSCSWNSLYDAPKIFSKMEEMALNFAKASNLTFDSAVCRKKLKKEEGKEFCIGCFIDFIKNRREVSYKDVENEFKIPKKFVKKTVKELILSKEITGVLDGHKSTFIYIKDEEKEEMYAQIVKEGYIDLERIKDTKHLSLEGVMKILISIIRDKTLRGTFSIDKKKYFTEAGFTNILINTIKTQGRIKHEDIARKYSVVTDIIKRYILENILKPKIMKAYFADMGNQTVSREKLEKEITEYCEKKGRFPLKVLASDLKVTEALVRKRLFKRLKIGTIRGLFTQDKQFITEDKFIDEIKQVARAYKKSHLEKLANRFAVTEKRVEKTLTMLISRGSIAGYLDGENHMFIAEGEQPITKFGGYANQASPKVIPQGNIEVVREYDFVGGQLHFKVVVRNKSNMAIHDIKVILDVPSSYKKAEELINISVIDPGNTHGVDFYLEPRECGISTLGGMVIYKDAMGTMHTLHVKKKDVQIKCPLIIKDMNNIDDCKKVIQSLPSDARAFLISDIPPEMAYAAAHRAISQFDARNVASFENTEGEYEAESWFSATAKVTKGRIVIRAYFNGKRSTLEIRIWCNEAGQLTGLLAKVIEKFYKEINLMRELKAGERNKTIHAMAITRSIMEILDICMLRFKANNARLKLEDIHTRLQKLQYPDQDLLDKVYKWVKDLEEKYAGEDDMLEDEDADNLEKDMTAIQQSIESHIGVE